jgi:hypothetical protein
MHTLVLCYETHLYYFKDEKVEQVEFTFKTDLDRIGSGNKSHPLKNSVTTQKTLILSYAHRSYA